MIGIMTPHKRSQVHHGAWPLYPEDLQTSQTRHLELQVRTATKKVTMLKVVFSKKLSKGFLIILMCNSLCSDYNNCGLVPTLNITSRCFTVITLSIHVCDCINAFSTHVYKIKFRQ